MNPQYLTAKQQPQYGPQPTSNFGVQGSFYPQPGGGVDPNSNRQFSPQLNTPPQPQQQQQHFQQMQQQPQPPQQQMIQQQFQQQPPPQIVAQRPLQPQGFMQQPPQQSNYPPNIAPRMPGPGMPPVSGQPPMQPPFPPINPNQLSSQMMNMNLNGVQRPPMPSQMQMPPGPMVQPPQPGMGSGPPPPGGKPFGQNYPPTVGLAPQQQYSSVNGAGPQMMNGLPEPSGPGRGGPQIAPPLSMQQRYPPVSEGQSPTGVPPGMPGYYPQFPQHQQPQQGYSQTQQQPARRLDPDQMPSPLQVMLDDQKAKGGSFYTNQKGQMPPLVTTDFIVQDQGNASPRFIRSTMYNVPINADIMKQISVPFGLVISPMAEVYEGEQPPPVVDMGEIGPIRCIRCKAYMCPNMQFIDGGRRFHCLLCKATTEVPSEYFQHLDHTGQRVDRFDRPELVLGTYEFIATKEYCKDDTFPKPPALIFLIDVSYNNVKSGLVSLVCSQMKNFLQHLPKEAGNSRSSMKVGFITYNTVVHFYNVNPNLGQPQMLVVGDTQEMFMPLLDGFLVDPVESETVIDTLMQQIPTMFSDTRETETVLAPAIQAGLEALKASGCAGKLLVFHSSLPTAEAPGKLKNRDDRKVLGTDKEKTVLTPQNTVYNNLGQDCVGVGCSVDLFIFNNSYIDLATIGQVSRLTGGEIYKYTYFQADCDGERLIADVEKNVSRLCAFDAIMRVRTSTGIRPTDFYGHFFMSNTTDIEFASVDPDKAVALEIKHDDKLSEDEGVYIQAALLYTSISGVRKIRVINLALKSSGQMADLYRTCELDTIINFFSKQSIFKLLELPPKTVKENLIARSAQILACYRKNCASPTSAGQLILPECMKLLPLYINCILKSDAVSGGSDMTVDDRWFTMAAVTMMDVPSSVVYFYPRLLSLLDMEGEVPAHIRCSAEKMSDNGVYLLVNGIYMFLWLGMSVSSDWVMSVFGVPSVAQIDTDKNRLPILDNPLSEKVRGAISLVCENHHRSMRLTIVRQRDKMELVMKHFLVEDRGMDGSSSYVDFLCHMHKEIRSILS